MRLSARTTLLLPLVVACSGEKKTSPAPAGARDAGAIARAPAIDAAPAAPVMIDAAPVPANGPRSQVLFMTFMVGDGAVDGSRTFMIELEPQRGWVQPPSIEVDISAGGKALATQTWTTQHIDGTTLSVPFMAPAAGTVVATVKADGVLVGSVKSKASDLEPGRFKYVVREVKPRKVTRCEGLDCPGFPALSPDGKVIAVREAEELPGEFCGPPTAVRTRFLRVGRGDRLEPAPSQDLAGFEVLKCQGARELVLPDRHKVVFDVGERRVTLSDPAGVEIARTETSYESDLICTSASQRVVVVRGAGSLGGDCDELAEGTYLTFAY